MDVEAEQTLAIVNSITGKILQLETRPSGRGGIYVHLLLVPLEQEVYKDGLEVVERGWGTIPEGLLVALWLLLLHCMSYQVSYISQRKV